MTDKTLDQLLEDQRKLAEEIAKAQKVEQASAIASCVELIKKYNLTPKMLSSAFGYKEPTLEAKERKPAKDKYCFMWQGTEHKWAGRGRPLKELVAFCESKGITVEAFKELPEYKLPE